MTKRIPLKSGDEYDALTRARRYLVYLTRPGVAKRIKRAYNRRFRRVVKQDTNKMVSTDD